MKEWGALAALAGEWVGGSGVDRAFSHTQGHVLDTPYREMCSMRPFGPVDSDSQELFGLDYRTAIWRRAEDHPFHAVSVADGGWSYEQTTMLRMTEFDGPLSHTDAHLLRRAG